MRYTIQFDVPRPSHWAVNRSLGASGPWVIQKAYRTGCGLSFDKPLPEHRNFKTKRDAQQVKRALGRI